VDYCRSIFSEENALLYLDVAAFKATHPQDGSEAQVAAAEHIFNKYFKPGSEFEMSAPSQQKQEWTDMIEQKKTLSSMFDRAQKAAFLQVLAELVPNYLEAFPEKASLQSAASPERKTNQDVKVDGLTLDALMDTILSLNSGTVRLLFFCSPAGLGSDYYFTMTIVILFFYFSFFSFIYILIGKFLYSLQREFFSDGRFLVPFYE